MYTIVIPNMYYVLEALHFITGMGVNISNFMAGMELSYREGILTRMYIAQIGKKTPQNRCNSEP